MNLDRSRGAFDLGVLLVMALAVVACTPGPEFEVRINAYTCELPAGYTGAGACAEPEKFVGINYARLDKQNKTAVTAAFAFVIVSVSGLSVFPPPALAQNAK